MYLWFQYEGSTKEEDKTKQITKRLKSHPSGFPIHPKTYL